MTHICSSRLVPRERNSLHVLQKCLAPWGVLLGLLEGRADADVPPAFSQTGQTGQTGQTQDEQTVRPRPLWRAGLTIDSVTPIVLPLHGSAIGSPFALTCGPDELVTGVWGRAGNSVDGLGLFCSRMRPNGSLQMAEQRPALGSAMSPPFTLQCPQHEAVIAMRGRAFMQLDRLGLSCARVRSWVNQGNRGAVLSSVGGAAGSPFADECPAGYLFQGLFGYSNGSINAIQGLCVPIVSSKANY